MTIIWIVLAFIVGSVWGFCISCVVSANRTRELELYGQKIEKYKEELDCERQRLNEERNCLGSEQAKR